MTEGRYMTELEWASFIEKPDAHLGPADRGLVAAIIRRQKARIADLEARQRSVRAAADAFERQLRELGEKP